YQAGKVIILSAVDKDKLVQLPRTFDGPMGMATAKDALAVATKDEVVVLRNSKTSAPTYPDKKNVYDGMYLPRATYYTGVVAMHDMAFLPSNELVGVNTAFSCLCKIDDNFSFTPFWQPDFIDAQAPEDRCHLNGMALEDGEIKYLTALGTTNTPQGWRDTKMTGGVVMEYPSGKIIADGLGMPHSPRIYNQELYVLNSTQGELLKINRATGAKEVICQLGGFARGMSRCGDYLFIGISKLRHNSTAFNDLPIADKSFAGVVAVYLPYGSVVGSFQYNMTVDEIYDVKVLPQLTRPSLLSPRMEAVKNSLVTPTDSFWKA
ncbi:MAG: TIGR03032 family protein, partial [Flavobacteriales bacterium]